MSKHKYQTIGFSDLFDRSAVPTPPRTHKTFALLKMLIVAPLSGLLVATSLTPYAFAFSGTTDTVLTAWEDMPHDLGEIVAKQRTVLLDKNGKQFGQLFSENRVNVTLEDINPVVVQALLDTEDTNFYTHGSLDAKGILRATYKNATSDSMQGASTISQQLVENLRVMAATSDKERSAAKANSLPGKLQELRYATELERNYTKDEILIQYLNTVYLGNGAYGIDAAAQRYFSTTAKNLTVDQSATLIAMLKSPMVFDPIDFPAESRLRRDVVMKRMVVKKHLTQTQYDTFRMVPTELQLSTPRSGCEASTYPYYCALLIRHILVSPEFGKTAKDRETFLAQGGLTITTALDPKVMSAAQKAVDRALGRTNRVAAGSAIIQPGTGRLLGIAQNRTFGEGRGKTEIVLPATTQFQPGSTFKPITLATAFEQGISTRVRYNTPSPIMVNGLDSPPGGYKNDDSRGHGNLDAYGATKGSVNTWFVQLVRDVGVKNVATMARRLGMYSMPTDLNGREGSITLGAYETSPVQLATVYATFAARGVQCDPVLILKATINTTGKTLKVPDGDCHQAILPNIADTVADVLQETFKSGGTASKVTLANGRKAGGKTGTTNSNAATWFSGFTPQAAMSVWVGDPRGGNRYPVQNIRAYGTFYGTVWGGTVAGPIWQETMNKIHRGLKKRWLPSPTGVSSSLTSRLVPAVGGMKLDEAVTLLQEQGFVLALNPKNAKPSASIQQPGFVYSQTPTAGGTTGHGTKVTLTLTAGSPTNIILKATK